MLAAVRSLVLGLLATYAPVGVAAILTFSTTLLGPNESPPNASPGTGQATVVVDTITNLMSVHVSFSGLLATTTASHIHCCTALPGTGIAGVATQVPTFTGFPLGVTAGTYDHTFDLTDLATYNPAFVGAHGGTAVSAEADLVAGLLSGRAYLNIHTTMFPGGEIRGFLVPEPATLALLAAGLVAAGWSRRRAA
jgi:hypothetical protein